MQPTVSRPPGRLAASVASIQVHIDYRTGTEHTKWYNDDVAYDKKNEEEYKKWYGPLPGLIP